MRTLFYLSGCFFTICSLAIEPCYSQELSLLPHELVRAIINEVSGEVALQNEIMLAPFERIRSEEEFTTQFWETDYIMKKAREYGLEVELHTFPADQPTWRPLAGELWMVRPEKKKIADVKDVAAFLATGSQTVKTEAPLIHMESASRDVDYENRDVRGKIILTPDRVASAQRIGVTEKGALGVVSYTSGSPAEYADTVGWQRSLRSDEEDAPFFGFSISRRMGEALKKMILDGKEVVVSVNVESRFYPGRDEVVSAVIPGGDLKEEEFVLTAHLYEGISKQGANDNNSGSACILEVGRTIARLMEDGIIERPRRTIRFVWVPEYDGNIKFLEKHPEIMKRMIGGINMDTVGLDLYRNNSPFHVYRTPHSLPSYLNYVAENLTEYAVKTNRVTIDGRPYDTILAPSGTQQNFMCWVDEFDSASDNDVYNIRQVGVPMVYFNNYTDDVTHTNLDAPERSDTTQLKRAGFLGTAITLAVAGAGEEDALTIAAESYHRSRSRLALSQKKAVNLLSLSEEGKTAEVYQRAGNLVEQSYLVEMKGLESCLSLARSNEAIRNYVGSLKENLAKERETSLEGLGRHYELLCRMRGIEPREPAPSETQIRLSRRIPRVITEEVWPSIQRVGGDLEIHEVNHATYETFNFIDGKRSILDIARAVDAELIDAGGVSLETVEQYLMALETAGFIEIDNGN